MTDLDRGLKLLRSRSGDYEEAMSYADGSVQEFFTSDAVRKKLAGSGSTFRLNFSAIPIEARVNRLKVEAYSTGSTSADKALDAAFVEPNDLDEEHGDFFRLAASYGDYYLIVWEGDTAGDEDGSTVTSVEVVGSSPLTTAIVYSRANSRRALFAIKRWESDETDESGKPLWRANLYYPDRIEEYLSTTGTKGETGDDFEPIFETGEDGAIDLDSWPIPNPYGVLPVFHLRQGGKPYGKPVHKEGFGAQDAINKLNITHMGTIDFQGFPQRYALVDADSEDDDGGDDFDIDFETTGVHSSSDEAPDFSKRKAKLKTGPGETWFLRGLKSVGQFDPAGHEVFLAPMKFQIRALARLTGTPAYEFDLDGGGQPSGELRRREDAPLSASIESMQRSYGQALGDAAAFAATILSLPVGKVEVKWKTAEVSTAKEDWEVIGLKIDNGVPVREALREGGYTPEEVEEWYPKGAPALSPTLVAKLATALGAFGQAVAGGAMTDEDVRAALPALFIGDRPERETSREPVVELPPVEDDVEAPAPGGE